MDDDISKLLKEAKPLCVLTLQMFYPKSDVVYDYYTLENEIYLTENGSVIEDMGLPTDEYGLLKVV